MPSYPLVNGKRYDFSSVEISAGPNKFLGVKEVTYSDGLEPGMVYGSAAQPIGRTRGQYKPEAAITMYRQEADEFLAGLGDGFMEQSFNIKVTYADDGQPTVTDVIVACRITKKDHSASGTDALDVKFTLSPMFIRTNHLSPIAKPLV